MRPCVVTDVGEDIGAGAREFVGSGEPPGVYVSVGLGCCCG